MPKKELWWLFEAKSSSITIFASLEISFKEEKALKLIVILSTALSHKLELSKFLRDWFFSKTNCGILLQGKKKLFEFLSGLFACRCCFILKEIFWIVCSKSLQWSIYKLNFQVEWMFYQQFLSCEEKWWRWKQQLLRCSQDSTRTCFIFQHTEFFEKKPQAGKTLLHIYIIQFNIFFSAVSDVKPC